MSPLHSSAQRLLAELLRRFGPHPTRAWAIPLDSDAGTARWLLACALLARSTDPARAAAALRAFDAAGLGPSELAFASPLPLARMLAREKLRDPDSLAPLLIRLARGLSQHAAGSLERLAAACDGLEPLASELARLAPGFGPASVLAFLRPLRDSWPAAREVPLDPNARAAAQHLGLLAEGDDAEGEPGVLRAALARLEDPAAADPAELADADPLELADAEWALSQLGRAACAHDRVARCPLAEQCPRREAC